jgi:opacity protein-like surface antigen
MKKVLLCAAVMAAGFCATAQESEKTLKFSAGVEAGLPISSEFKDASSFGIGGSLQGEYAVAEPVGVTLNAGFMSFPGKKVDEGFGITSKVSSTFIPVLAGAKFYFAEKFYAHAQLGITFWKAKSTITFNEQTESESASTSAFTYAPGIGFKATENFDIELKYQSLSKSGTSSFIGLRAAYTF